MHNLVKTKVLLLRDLPFITRISKYYDSTLFDNSLTNSSKSYSNSTDVRENKSSDNQFDYNNVMENSSHLNDTINSHNDYEDDVMTLMQAQIPKSDTLNGKSHEETITDEDIDKLISPAHWETIRKAEGNCKINN